MICLKSKGLSRVQNHSSKSSVLYHSAFFIEQLSHPYLATGKNTALTRWTFVGKVISLLFNMLSRLVMLKIIQTRLQQYVNHEIPDVQAGFIKVRGTRDQNANIPWIIEKARESRKTSMSTFLTMPKTLTLWITTDCGKF